MGRLGETPGRIIRCMRYVLGLALGAGSLTLLLGSTTPVAAKPDYTRRTSKACSFCHVPPGYNLNEAGKYYYEHGYSLKGYEPSKPKAKASQNGFLDD